ncbi:phage tail protein [Vitiosangium sp. GDMCC 1.1324]|uniref:phage tail protein n=1 Tax=Vitiosangium sp. (strain GDMCC 1.1324) TaxID=2138576 RepID=UPI000D352750|nr:phage tail protein [Vitiosangium sp. GDMCC 1.1324]PTL85207.1 phage tail protein [Vitiosangium sp. GDMCC 1.1324]
MDANQQRFWMMADPLRHWEPLLDKDGHSNVHRDSSRRTVRLASAPGDFHWDEPADAAGQAEAELLVQQTPGTFDAFGTWAYLDAQQGAIMAAGADAEPLGLLSFDPGNPLSLPSDLVLGNDDVLYVADGGGKVLLKDLRNRWAPATVSVEDFQAWRLAPAPTGGVFAIPRPTSFSPASPARVRLARVSGLPLHRDVLRERAPTVFRPQEEDTDPPRMSLVLDAPPLPGEVLVGLATSPEGRLALLSWVYDAASAGASGNDARIRFFTGNGLTTPITLLRARRPISFAWLSADRLVVLLRTSTPSIIAVAYALEDVPSAAPLGDYYPLTSYAAGPLLHGLTAPPHYPTQDGAPAPLHPISLPSFATTGSMRNQTGAGTPLIDGGSARAIWHRLYLEACIPPRCGIRVFLAATSTPQRPLDDEPSAWHEHVFGDVAPASTALHVPRGVWLPTPSELPFHSGLMTEAPEPERRGLFTVLVQRAGLRVRTLQGRYLWVRVQLVGDGRSTPELFALRAHGPRFSYAENYLPELYREQLFGPDADAKGTSTPADFLERFLGLAEGILTPLEDRIASASLLTDPRTVPEESLEWLAAWLGVSFDPALSREQRRQMLEAAPAIRPWRGTLRGLSLALDALTGGAVSQGGLVIVEEFRLRRTFSTILGIDLSDDEDPLLPGLHQSGNSFVGDTLFLGDERRKEFLALFGEDLPKTAAEEAAVEEFFNQQAHRVTVLVHQDFDAQEFGLIQRVAEQEAPAHVSLAVKLASQPLMVGVASLVGLDTYLGPTSRPQPMRVGRNALGSKNLIERPPSLDPRLHAGG